MDNYLPTEVEIRRIVLAYFGGTKGGKTTGIAALTKIPDVIIDLASGDDGRTKTTVQYHIVPDEELSEISEEEELLILRNTFFYINKVSLFDENVIKLDGRFERG